MAENPSQAYEQSGVIPFRFTGDEVEVLLVTSRNGKRWVIPKGLREPDLTPLESALKEAYEEAGIRGSPRTRSIGAYSYEKWGGTCYVEVFALQVERMLKEWPESHFRDRAWMAPEEAAVRVAEPELADLLRAAARWEARD